MILKSFEAKFYIPLDKAQDGQHGSIKTSLVNRRGIYKDTFGSKSEFADYQLRPNMCVALLVVSVIIRNLTT
jgi:glycogen debranching enzyme